MTEGIEPGTLYVVSTPIGNLADISARAIRVLSDCDVVFAEDTRTTRVLLSHCGIKTRLESLHEHNEASVVPRTVARLRDGGSAALVSDAGTPLVSDPGERLVQAVIAASLAVIAVPGASALLTALVVSGLPAAPFTFFGFVPRKHGEKTELAAALSSLSNTAICYESPERVAETLAGWVEAGLGARRCVVARELTKRYEEVRRGTVDELAAYHQQNPPRGEVVLLLEGGQAAPIDEQALESLARTWREEGLSAREVARRLSEDHGAPRNLAYRIAHR